MVARLLTFSAGLLAGLALAACASAPVDEPASPLAVCQAMSANDAGLTGRLSSSGATVEDFCACFVTVSAGLDDATRTDTFALMSAITGMREGTGRTTEDVAELMEDDRDGAQYGFPEERFKRAAQPFEDSMTRARRDRSSCAAS